MATLKQFKDSSNQHETAYNGKKKLNFGLAKWSNQDLEVFV